MGPFKRGGVKLAIEAQAPVVPVSLIGLRQVIGRKGITPGHVRVRIHEALDSVEGPVAIETLVKQAESVIREEVES